MATTMDRTLTPMVSFQPISLHMVMRVATHGMYTAITTPNTTNWSGVMNASSATPPARICSMPRAISFLRMPTMNAMEHTAGSPSMPTMTGESGSTMTSRRSYCRSSSTTMDPTTSSGKAM